MRAAQGVYEVPEPLSAEMLLTRTKKPQAKQGANREKDEMHQPRHEQLEPCSVYPMHLSNRPRWAWWCKVGKGKSGTSPPHRYNYTASLPGKKPKRHITTLPALLYHMSAGKSRISAAKSPNTQKSSAAMPSKRSKTAIARKAPPFLKA